VEIQFFFSFRLRFRFRLFAIVLTWAKKINTPKEAKIKITNMNWVPEVKFKCNIMNFSIKCFCVFANFQIE